MAKNKSNSALSAFLAGIVLIFVGLAITGVSLMLNDDNPDTALTYNIVMYVGIGIAVLGIIVLVAGIVSGRKGSGKKQKTTAGADSVEVVGDVEIQLDGTTTYSQAPTSVEHFDRYEFVTVGRRQSLEDKFEQIGKMGKTQFVIYMAKLFSLKGFEVQLTPVIDNHDIDMIVKNDGVARAVACMISNKVLCREDIEPAFNGKSFYNVDGVMVVTNMYFDRTSLDYAKAHKMTLVDRNILSEQYMK